MNKTTLSHLRLFKKIFGYDVSREYNDRLEYRLRGDLDVLKAQASRVISKNNLNLKVNSTGNMAQINSFEIIPT